ncbi:MAG: single-stranded DNA-binding protein [Burkholderiales bacterium]|nr:single-stranded DNA-binding protein [Burkholderiales bacterium]
MENTLLIDAARRLRDAVEPLTFSPPVTHTYNPLIYAWAAHREYLARYGASPKKVLFVGMNPGPFGMAQTGIPFGEIAAVRDWLKIKAPVDKPIIENPHRPIEGFDCPRSEVSGRRLWGLFQERFVTPTRFFADHFVLNYCPLAFFSEGKNITPDQLPITEQTPLLDACDAHLSDTVKILKPRWVIGVGAWAEKRLKTALADAPVNIGRILHPSPASPAANQGWDRKATEALVRLGVW